MKVLIACEFSGTVRDAFSRLGHDAWSCDLLPSETPGNHIQGDVTEVIRGGFDLMIAHPPCTYLCSSGMHWTTRGHRDPKLTEDAIAFVRALLNAPIPKIAVENPVGAISTRLRPADQYIQPYQFGHDASKTDSGQNKLGPSEDRWAERSKTYYGIAEAMATQWGPLPLL